jgi:hypothetical protein
MPEAAAELAEDTVVPWTVAGRTALITGRTRVKARPEVSLQLECMSCTASAKMFSTTHLLSLLVTAALRAALGQSRRGPVTDTTEFIEDLFFVARS